jgi:hypothetical protein
MTHATQLRTSEARLAALRAFDAAKAAGHTNREAAELAGISFPTAWRYRRKFTAGGSDALVFKTSSGRPSLFDLVGLLPTTLAVVQEHRLSRVCRSSRHAIRRAMHDGRCTAEQRRKLAPYSRAQSKLPNAFVQLLRVQRCPRIELVCGQSTRLLKGAKA